MAPDDSPGHAARHLRRRFGLILLATAVPVLAVLVMLAVREFQQARDRVIRDHADALQVRRAGLEQMAHSVATHVGVMRAFAEQRLDLRGTLPPYQDRLDWPPGAPDPGPDRGMILADAATLPADLRQEITAVSPIFAVARATHATRPWLRWSYYFSASKSFVAIYPWAPPGQMLGTDDPAAALRSYFDYELYTSGEPAANPDRAAYWSPVYFDAGGSGLMLTHAAPVWSSGAYMGIVGTDVLLSHISEFLAGFPTISGRIVVVDQAGNLIASPDGAAPVGSAPAKADAVLGGRSVAETGGTFLRQGSDLVSSVAIAGTPWQLVMTIPDSDVRAAAMDRLAPLAALMAGLLVSLGLVSLIFNRQFVTPAVALAEFGALPPGQPAPEDVPDLPDPWRPMAGRILSTARAQAAQTAHLRAMIDGVPLRAVYVDARHIYRDANREFLAFTGLGRDQVVGHSVAEVLGPVVDAQYTAMQPLIRRGEVGRFDGWIDYGPFGRRYLQVSVLPFLAPGEEAPGFLTFTRDLTDLKLAETEAERHLAALTEREDRYRSVVVSALDAIIVMDDAGTALEFNPAAERMFGYAADQAIGRKVADLIVPPAMRAAHTAGMARYLDSDQPHVLGRRIEVQAMRADGSEFPVELAITEVRQGAHRIFTSHLRDLTDARRLAREMQESRDRLHQVEKLSAMGSLLAGVAHELNNPLAIAVAQSTLLVDKAPDADTRQRAERIRAAADRCGRIVKSFLAMARQKPPKREPLALTEVIGTALEVVGYGLRSSGVTVDQDMPADLPPVMADRDLLGQVFSNLFINAQQALSTRAAPRLLHVSACAQADWLRIRVQDNGPGVPEAVRGRIFDPYFTTKAVEVGTGIGLSISRNVIEAHGGAITLAEGDLGGACFEIRLPVAPAMPTEPGAGPEATAGPVLAILVVDDEPDVAASLAEMLEMQGHAAAITDDPHKALQLAGEGRLDAVFTDLRMPAMDGAELARHLIARHPEMAGRIVLMTGDTVGGPALIAAAGLAGVKILEKPFLPADVAAVLKGLPVD